MKRYVTISIILLFSISGSAFGAAVDDLRTRISEREAQMKSLAEEIAVYERALESQEGETKTLNAEIQRLNTQIKKINADIAWTEQLIEKTELTIEELTITIDEKEKSIHHDEDVLAELLRALNESDEQSLIEVLFGFGDISEFFEQIEQSQRVNEAVQYKLKSLQEERELLKNQAADQEEEENSLSVFKETLAGRKYAEQSVKNNKATLLDESQDKEALYQQNIKERERRRELIQSEIAAIEYDLQALIDPSKLPEKAKGVLTWPVEDPYITQGFGFTEFATTYGSDIYKNKGHNGVDFRAAIGDRILAVASGTVKGAGNTDLVCPGGSYGKWVNIEHGNNLSTVYGHLSQILVKEGDAVTRGQLIAYSGASGYVTGPHLHLTLYASDTYRLAKTNNCGYVPAGGFLNPLDYL